MDAVGTNPVAICCNFANELHYSKDLKGVLDVFFPQESINGPVKLGQAVRRFCESTAINMYQHFVVGPCGPHSTRTVIVLQ